MSRLFVGRLPRDVRERDLERLFKGYGEIRDICLRQGFGFVEFRERRDAEDVIHDFDGRDFMGERLMIEPARADRRRERFRGERGERDYGRRDDRRRGAMNGPQRTPYRIIVENLSSSVSWQDLKDFARRAGEVSFADAHKLHPGEGIVEFTDESGLRNALRKLDGVELRGRRVIIREEMGRGGGGGGSSGGRRSYSRRSRSRSYSPRERSPEYRRSSYRSRSPPRRMSRSRSPPRRMSRSQSRSPRSASPADERLPPPPPDRRSLSPVSARSPSSHDMAAEPEPAVNVDEPMASSNDNWAIASGRDAGVFESPGRRLSALDSPRGSLRRPLSSLGGLGSSSLYGASAEEKVVLDVGTAMLRAGFSGDHEPLYRGQLFGRVKAAQPFHRLVGTQAALDATVDDDTLDALVLAQLRELYRSHLLLDPKTRGVAVCEGPMLPVQIKRSLCRVLLGNLRVPQVTFYPAAVVSLMTCGVTAGLVVDCGHRGTTVTPVYEGRPLMAYAVPTALGGDALARHVRGLLKQHGKFQPFGGPPEQVTDEILSADLCAFIVRRLVDVSPVLLLDELDDDGVQVCRDRGLALGHTSEQATEAYAATQQLLSLPAETRLTVDTARGRGDLLVPSWICAFAADVLLYGDARNDHEGILGAVSRCLGRAPVDIRRQLVSHLLVVGGIADLPSFSTAVAREVQFSFERGKWRALAGWVALANEHVAAREDPTAGPPQRSSPNGAVFGWSDRCWIGTSLAVAAKIGGLDINRDDFAHNLPDWSLDL
ncbi:hypothetical protein EV183_004016 [Coemansia sp. RSA 2336]|nr:hypothetical protein EV183_004016 [Coemansia sp. RSA 2336]